MTLPAPDPGHFWQFFLSAAAAIVIIERCLALYRNYIRTPDPMPPLHKEYTPRVDHEKLTMRVDGVVGEMRTGFRSLDHERRVSVAKCYEKTEQAINHLRGEIKADSLQQRSETKEELVQFRNEMRTDIRGIHDSVRAIATTVAKHEERTLKHEN